jgi:sigma-B regulation protein RsbU (phosphoserine phosphatase)
VASALLMASLQACLRGQVLGGEQDLAKVMANINQMIFDVSPVNKYATFFYGQYEAATRTLRYVNGGHNPPVVLRGDEVIRLEDGGPVVGLFRPARYVSGSVVLEAGDLLVGFTDGVSEAMNPADDEWGEDALVATAGAAREQSPEAIIEALIAGADRFAAGAPQHDDMTLLVMKVVSAN